LPLFLLQALLFIKWLVKLPPNAKDMGKEILVKFNKEFKKWLQGQIFGFFFYSSAISFRFMDSRITTHTNLALIAGLSNFVPNFGPVIAAIPAILGLTLGTSSCVCCLSYVLIQIIQSAVTQPLIQKRMLSIPPALIILVRWLWV
jgi:predicted PurR-regulated permease PerM